jgi:monoamine oxidase
MTKLTRRSAITGIISTISCPAVARLQCDPDFDVLIVGAGAAGIAAAKRLGGAKQQVAILEASDRLGGRCFTDMKTFGLPYDQGASLVHLPPESSLTRLATRSGIELYSDPKIEQILHRGGRSFEKSLEEIHSKLELEEFYTNKVRCCAAIANAAANKGDISCDEALPKDLDDWRWTMEFVLGPYHCGVDLKSLSAKEYVPFINRDPPVLCRYGVGGLIGKLALGVPIKFFSPVTLVEWRDRLVRLETNGGSVTARAVIITASTAVLASGKIKFKPDLPATYSKAFEKLKLGSYDHVAIEFNRDFPLGLENNEIVFEKTSNTKTAALFANVNGSRISILKIPGRHGAELVDQGEGAMIDFAIDWINGVFGSDAKKAIGRTHTTAWNKQSWALGAFSSAYPGAQEARKVLSEPISDSIWFAGEALNQDYWGTVGGAWQEGERAADGVIGRFARNPHT